MSPRSLALPHNMYFHNGMLVQRTGMLRGMKYDGGGRPTASTDYLPRGILIGRDQVRAYAIFGNEVYNITTFGWGASLGTISAPPSTQDYEKDRVSHAVGFTGIAFATGDKNYFINTITDTMAELTDPDLPACRSVAYVDGRYLWVALDGESVFYSEVNDPGNVTALSFFDAESRPDLNKEVAVIGNDVYVLGATSIERFRNTGSQDTPFIRVTNSVLSIGYRGGLISLSDRLVFVGQAVGGGIAIYQLDAGRVTVISNEPVNEMLNHESWSGINNGSSFNCESQSFDEFGSPVYTFTFNSRLTLYCRFAAGVPTWGTLSDNPENAFTDFHQWGITDFLYSSATFSRRFHYSAGVFYLGAWMFQRAQSLDDAGVFWKSEYQNSRDDPTINAAIDKAEAEEPISKGFRGFIRDPLDSDFALDSVEVAYSKQGAYRRSSNSNPSGGDTSDLITLRVSTSGVGWGYGITGETEGREWSAEETQSYGDKGDSGRVQFATLGGISETDGYIGIVIESRADIPLTIEKVIIE